MVSAESTSLTERQVTVLKLREEGHTQREIAERLGTTDSNVSAIERAARDNVERARRTLELVRTLATPVRFTVEADTEFEELIDEIYARGNESGTKVDYCRPDLYTHLYGALEGHIDGNRITSPVEVGITGEGNVKVFPGEE